MTIANYFDDYDDDIDVIIITTLRLHLKAYTLSIYRVEIFYPLAAQCNLVKN